MLQGTYIRTKYNHTHKNKRQNTPDPSSRKAIYFESLELDKRKKIQTTFEHFSKINEYNQCYALKPNPSGCATAGAANVACACRSSVRPQPLEGWPAAGQPCGLESWLTDPGSSCRDSPPPAPQGGKNSKTRRSLPALRPPAPRAHGGAGTPSPSSPA